MKLNNATSTDSRPLYERKQSVQLRISELRTALAAAEKAEREIDARLHLALDCGLFAAEAQ